VIKTIKKWLLHFAGLGESNLTTASGGLREGEILKREVKTSDVIAKFEPTAKRGRAPI